MADDYNSAQQLLGLLGTGSFAGQQGGPVAPMQAPQVRHPGDVSVQAGMMSQQMGVNTAQVSQMHTASGGGFASQFRANMGQINSQAMNPFAASMFGGGGFGGGMGPMFPSASMGTAPSMGIYRPFPNGPAPMIPMTPPPMSFMPHPFAPTTPMAQFQTPFEYSQNVGTMQGDRYASAATMMPGVGAHLATAAGSAYMGRGLGAALGFRFGGARGAGWGATLGLMGGLAASEMGGLGHTAQHITDSLNPMHPYSMRAAGLQSMSQGFVNGGNGMAQSGRGLDTGGAFKLGRLMEDTVLDPKFRQATGGTVSMNDMMKLTSAAGQQGFLDNSQTPEQIKNMVVHLAKNMKVFMQLANEPDMKEAMKQMGQMRSMGLNIGETMNAMHHARTYARMAGTDVAGVMQAGGLQGAQMYQANGLSAGLGLQMGMGAYGMAKSAAGSGVYNPAQLSMLGGVSGVAQREMQSNLAMLKMPMMTAAGTSFSNGTFGLNSDNLHGMMTGKMGVTGIASAGVNNLSSAVAKGGVGALGMFQMQQSELQDQMGRALGPEGMKMMKMNQVQQQMKFLKLSGPGGFATAAMSLGMSPDEARQVSQEASTPDFFKNIQRQQNVAIRESRANAYQSHLQSGPTWGDRFDHFDRGVGGLAMRAFTPGIAQGVDMVRGGMTMIGRGRDLASGTSQFFHELGEDRHLGYGGMAVRTSDELLAGSSEEDARVHRTASGGSWRGRDRGWGGNTSAMFRVGGTGYGNSESMRQVRDGVFGGSSESVANFRQARGGLGAVFGGGIMEKGLRLTTGGVGFADSHQIDAELTSISSASKMLNAGASASKSEVNSSHSALDKIIGTKGSGANFSNDVATELAKIAQSKDHIGGSDSIDSNDIKAAIAAAASKNKYSDTLTQTLMANSSTITMGSTKTAMLLAGRTGAGAFRRDSAEGGMFDRKLNAIDRATLKQDSVANNVLGTNFLGQMTGLGDSAKTRREQMNRIFGKEDHRSSTVAALITAGHIDKANEFLKTLGKDSDKIKEGAERLMNDPSNKSALMTHGDRLSTMNTDTMMGVGAEIQGQMTDSKAALRHASGRLKLLSGVSDAGLVDRMSKANSARGELDEAVKSGALGESTDPKMKSLLQRYQNAKTDTQRDALAKEFDNLADSQGSEDTSNVTLGGLLGGGQEVAANKKKDAAADTAKAMAETFPDGAKTFQKGADTLLDAATRLGAYAEAMGAMGTNNDSSAGSR